MSKLFLLEDNWALHNVPEMRSLLALSWGHSDLDLWVFQDNKAACIGLGVELLYVIDFKAWETGFHANNLCKTKLTQWT